MSGTGCSIVTAIVLSFESCDRVIVAFVMLMPIDIGGVALEDPCIIAAELISLAFGNARNCVSMGRLVWLFGSQRR